MCPKDVTPTESLNSGESSYGVFLKSKRKLADHREATCECFRFSLNWQTCLLGGFDRSHVLAQFCSDLREQEHQANHVGEHHR